MNLLEPDHNPPGAMPRNNPCGDVPNWNQDSVHHWIRVRRNNLRMFPPCFNPCWVDELLDKVYACVPDYGNT